MKSALEKSEMNLYRISKRVDIHKEDKIWILGGIIFAFIIGVTLEDAKWLYLGVPLIPVLIIFSLRKPFIFPFGAYALLIPFDSILSVTGNEQGATLTKFLGIFTILILLLKGTFEKKIKRPDKVIIWWALFIVYAFVSIWWAIEPALVSSRMSTAGGLFILYLIVSMYRAENVEYETLKWCILIGGILSGIIAIHTFTAGQYFHETTQRGSLMFGEREANPNYFALTLIIPVFICLGMILMQKKKKLIKGLLVIAFVVLIYSIFVTGSRGALLGLLIGFIVYWLSAKSFPIKKRVTLIGMLIVSGIIVIVLVPEYFIERMSISIETGGAGRLDIWSNGYRLLKIYGLIGAGLDNFPNAFHQYAHFTPFSRKLYLDPHNIYLKTFVELGILGISLLIMVILKHFRALRLMCNEHNSEHVMLKAALSAILVASFFSTFTWTKSFWLIFTLILIYQNVMRDSYRRYFTHALNLSK